jgi:hypothetical protein
LEQAAVSKNNGKKTASLRGFPQAFRLFFNNLMMAPPSFLRTEMTFCPDRKGSSVTRFYDYFLV